VGVNLEAGGPKRGTGIWIDTLSVPSPGGTCMSVTCLLLLGFPASWSEAWSTTQQEPSCLSKSVIENDGFVDFDDKMNRSMPGRTDNL